jgi:predicted cupin superfamily sugar epimerase
MGELHMSKQAWSFTNETRKKERNKQGKKERAGKNCIIVLLTKDTKWTFHTLREDSIVNIMTRLLLGQPWVQFMEGVGSFLKNSRVFSPPRVMWLRY